MTETDVLTCPCCGGTTWNRRFDKQGFDVVRCAGCRLERLDPLPTPQELAAHYACRSVAGNYELAKARFRVSVMRSLFERFRFDAAGDPPSIFDVGCFDGLLLDLARAAGWKTAGVELQAAAAAVAREKHGAGIYTGTLEELRLPADCRFDVISATDVIEHLLNPEALFAFAARHLAESGILVLQTPDCDSLPARLMGRYWWCYAAPEHTFYFSARNLAQLGRRFGFLVVRRKAHWKTLPLGYVIDQMAYFGPEIYRIVRPASRLMPAVASRIPIPAYGGEMELMMVRGGGQSAPAGTSTP